MYELVFIPAELHEAVIIVSLVSQVFSSLVLQNNFFFQISLYTMGDWSDKLSFREFTDFLERLVKSPKKTRYAMLVIELRASGVS